MIRLALLAILFLLSLLNIFRAPHNLLWYVSILTTEFGWIFSLFVLLLIFLRFSSPQFHIYGNILGILSLVLFLLPLFQALHISNRVATEITECFPASEPTRQPFNLSKIMSGISARQIEPNTYEYDSIHHLQLDHFPAQQKGPQPCILVIHGGSWAGGNKQQLPELNSLLALNGYNVVAINYRLAPAANFPAPLEDVQTAIHFLQSAAQKLNIDAQKIILLGRSAGGQIALTAAYTLKEPAILGVISYYGPTDLVWGYRNPANPLVLDSRKIIENYLGGTEEQVPQQYIRSSATEIAKNAIPTLLIQGKNDPLVAYDHCNRLDKKLNEFQIPHYVLRMPWATHGCDYSLYGPAGQLSTFVTGRFIQSIFSK